MRTMVYLLLLMGWISTASGEVIGLGRVAYVSAETDPDTNAIIHADTLAGTLIGLESGMAIDARLIPETFVSVATIITQGCERIMFAHDEQGNVVSQTPGAGIIKRPGFLHLIGRMGAAPAPDGTCRYTQTAPPPLRGIPMSTGTRWIQGEAVIVVD